MADQRIRVQAASSVRPASPNMRSPVLPPRPNWHDRAACSGREEIEFFPDREEAAAAEELNTQFCRTCPVRVTCLAGALQRDDYGIWAGTTRPERLKLTRSRSRVKCPRCRCQTLVSVDDHDICHGCGVSWKTEREHGEQRKRDDQ